MHFFYFQFKTYFQTTEYCFKKIIHVVSSDPRNTLPELPNPIFKEGPEEMEQGGDEVMEGTDKKLKLKT